MNLFYPPKADKSCNFILWKSDIWQ